MKKVFIGMVVLFFAVGIISMSYFYHEGLSAKDIGSYITGFALNPSDTSHVTRAFSDSTPVIGEIINVSLKVYINPSFSHSIYLIEEHVPAGITILNNGDAHQSGQVLKWAQSVSTGKLASATVSYRIKVPNHVGNFSFMGYYGIDGMNGNTDISGPGLLSVTAPCSSSWVNGTWSGWRNVSCSSNNLMKQASILKQTDKNHCTSSIVVFHKYRASAPCNYSTWKPHVYLRRQYFDDHYTTNFSSLNKSSMRRLSGLKFKRLNKSTILNFLGRVNISRNINLTNNLLMSNTWVYINSEDLPELNKSASIKFYNISFTIPVVFRNGAECVSSYCANVSYNKALKELSFDVNSFSNYSLREQGICGDGFCNSSIGENCGTCVSDCGACPSSGGGASISGGAGGNEPPVETVNSSHDVVSPDTYTPLSNQDNSGENLSSSGQSNPPLVIPKDSLWSSMSALSRKITLTLFSLTILVVLVLLLLLLKYRSFRNILNLPYSRLRGIRLTKTGQVA